MHHVWIDMKTNIHTCSKRVWELHSLYDNGIQTWYLGQQMSNVYEHVYLYIDFNISYILNILII